MALSEETRQRIGHQMKVPADSIVAGQLSDFFFKCEYQGDDCIQDK